MPKKNKPLARKQMKKTKGGSGIQVAMGDGSVRFTVDGGAMAGFQKNPGPSQANPGPTQGSL